MRLFTKKAALRKLENVELHVSQKVFSFLSSSSLLRQGLTAKLALSSLCVVKDDLDFLTPLPLSPKWQYHRSDPLHPVCQH